MAATVVVGVVVVVGVTEQLLTTVNINIIIIITKITRNNFIINTYY